jgi:hypothetical protein
MEECKHESLDKIIMGGKIMPFCATCGQVIAPEDKQTPIDTNSELTSTDTK